MLLNIGCLKCTKESCDGQGEYFLNIHVLQLSKIFVMFSDSSENICLSSDNRTLSISWNHRLIKVGKALQDHLVQQPLSTGL